jgi:septal ring factor EnvC (AmiA/AmiB activator)
MNVPVRFRRPLVVLGVLTTLVAGAATVQAAAAWTAASSPLVSRPPSVESLQAALATEQERSGALKAQLDELATGSTDLEAALDAARDRIAADATQAKALQDSLAAAKTKLAALEKSIRLARAGAARAPAASTGRPAAAPTQSHEDDDDHGEDDD